MNGTLRRLLLLLAIVALPALGMADDEIVKEFKKYFKKFKDTPSRVEAILSLEGTETVSVVDVLIPVLNDKELEVREAAIRVLGHFKEPAPIAEIFVQLEESKKDTERLGLLQAIAIGSYQGPSESLIACLDDKSWDVRRRAVQALSSRQEKSSIPKFVELTTDRESAVRCAALEGLTALSAREVIDPALVCLQDEVWQVRSSAIQALSVMRDKKSIEPLMARMELEEGRLQADIGEALSEVTGKNYGQSIENWKTWWERTKDRFVIPTDEELATARAARAEARERYKPSGQTTFHGIETPSRSILFIIDVSGSMEAEVVERERFEDGDYPSFRRIDIVKTELARTVEGLESYVNFNILSFATDIDQWKKKLVPANVLNKKSAIDYANKLEAIGGSSKEGLAGVGLTGSANLEKGKTNTYGALMTGLDIAAPGEQDKGYEVEVDTIFFLSDGRPTHGELVDVDDILKKVKEANELRKVVIHTIAIGEFQKSFMERLAKENGGVFVDLGR
ncbi:MAG: HEAT repeat domain-containing protein [Planctomycetes bacterium]|nr:HEAT repeat domain-containing protein [Planctomycetota bacterium]